MLGDPDGYAVRMTVPTPRSPSSLATGPRLRAPRLAAAGGVLLLAVGGVAAGASPAAAQTTTDQVEASVKAQFAEQGVALTRVRCGDVRAEAGARISCTALNPAKTELVLRGEVTAVEDGQVRFRVRAVYGNARGTAIAKEVKRLLEKEVGERARRVTCPKRVRIPTKRAVTCALTTRQGAVYSVRVTIDAKNRIRARVASRPR